MKASASSILKLSALATGIVGSPLIVPGLAGAVVTGDPWVAAGMVFYTTVAWVFFSVLLLAVFWADHLLSSRGG